MAIEIGAGTLARIDSLDPGRLFFCRIEGAHRLAISLRSAGGHAIWMNLSGSKAFELEASDEFRGNPPLALPLPYPPADIVVRIDDGSATMKFSDHQPGQLLFCEGSSGCIAARWPGLQDPDTRVGIQIDNWGHDRVASPRYAFDRWSLSTVDASGHWIDLVTRTENA